MATTKRTNEGEILRKQKAATAGVGLRSVSIHLCAFIKPFTALESSSGRNNSRQKVKQKRE